MNAATTRWGGGEVTGGGQEEGVYKPEREREVIVMQKSQFSGRLDAMRCDTARCRAIIITTGDIIPCGGSVRRGCSGGSRWRQSKRIGLGLMHF